MPTQRERSPLLFETTLGTTSVEVASRMKELEATGPVLKAGPIAAFAAVKARAAERIWLREGIVAEFGSNGCNFNVDYMSLFLFLLGRTAKPFYTSPWWLLDPKISP